MPVLTTQMGANRHASYSLATLYEYFAYAPYSDPPAAPFKECPRCGGNPVVRGEQKHPGSRRLFWECSCLLCSHLLAEWRPGWQKWRTKVPVPMTIQDEALQWSDELEPERVEARILELSDEQLRALLRGTGSK